MTACIPLRKPPGRRRTSSWRPAAASCATFLAATSAWLAATSSTSAEPPAKRDATANAAAPNNTPRDGRDWPAFLGPHGTGVSLETNLLEHWPKQGPPTLWKKRIGAGYSAPSIRGNRLVVHHRLRDREIVECLRPDTGDPVWSYDYGTQYRDPYGYNNGPRCTPLLTQDRCYTFGAEAGLLCLDLATGKKIWMRNCLADFDINKKASDEPNWFFGNGCTPILEGDKLIALVGGKPNSAVVAFDAATGKTVWTAVGRDTWQGVKPEGSRVPYKWTGEEQLVSYSSPIAATIHGKRHVLCLVRQGLVSLDPVSGKVNFKYWFRSRVFESVNAARPVVIGDKIFLSVAYRQGSALIQVGRDGKSFKVLWRNRRNLLAHWSTPIHVNGYVYGFSGRHEREGSLKCLNLKTGLVTWFTNGYGRDLSNLAQDPRTGAIIDRKTGRTVPWPFYGRGSKIQVGGRFIVLGERGTLALVKINSKRFEEIARTSYDSIRYPAWTAPVLSRKRLYLRDEDTLICLDLAPSRD